MADEPDINVPKLAERKYAQEKASEGLADWALEALAGDSAVLVEDDRAVQMERERLERKKRLERELEERTAVVEFLGAQRKAKGEALVIGRSKERTTSVLGQTVDGEGDRKKPKRSSAATMVVVSSKSTPSPTPQKKEAAAGPSAGLSLLGSYQ